MSESATVAAAEELVLEEPNLDSAAHALHLGVPQSLRVLPKFTGTLLWGSYKKDSSNRVFGRLFCCPRIMETTISLIQIINSICVQSCAVNHALLMPESPASAKASQNHHCRHDFWSCYHGHYPHQQLLLPQCRGCVTKDAWDQVVFSTKLAAFLPPWAKKGQSMSEGLAVSGCTSGKPG